ncbi:MAG: DUF3800 domain-containing protein [Firmicutes bacterium]|nr:DUF3800 domain-containing protein [Bacillota bacterium]
MINIYCDESCHLQFDNSKVMVLGAIKCPNNLKKKIYENIRNIKIKHGLSSWFEIKWTKVSKTKLNFYFEIIDYFFKEPALGYRGVVATNKDNLNHSLYNYGDYNLWYYKMYFLLLDAMIDPLDEYKIFIDIKDTQGGPKIRKLHEVLCNNVYDFKRDVIKDLKQIRSHESEVLELTDLLNGALSYVHRNLYNTPGSSYAKNKIIQYLKQKGLNLEKSTSRSESKFNIFIWVPRGCR